MPFKKIKDIELCLKSWWFDKKAVVDCEKWIKINSIDDMLPVEFEDSRRSQRPEGSDKKLNARKEYNRLVEEFSKKYGKPKYRDIPRLVTTRDHTGNGKVQHGIKGGKYVIKRYMVRGIRRSKKIYV